MKKMLALLLAALMLTGCAANTVAEATTVETTASTEAAPAETLSSSEHVSRFDSETVIVLSDEGITVNGGEETDTVYTSHDIIYYEDRDTYESGNPYGEGEENQRHSAEEAAAHTVVNITAPGAYRVSGTLSAGQIRIDLGDDAYDDPDAVVELILEDADITCTVAPAILFLNTYECDGNWSTETAQANVDTSDAGANLILYGENQVSGSHVARIYKDAEGEKKLWKQDGAIYSYMSMNVYGPGSLDLIADNEGLDTELHLTINGGNIAIRSQDDGINTNEDGVSVTTINGGSLHIIAGLGSEGDGIDSNGYLVINGGTVVASANPASDAGLDSDLGSYINGGTVVALGSTMDWAESDSEQVTMNLQFAQYQSSGSAIVVTKEDGTVVFAYDPSEDEVLGENMRQFMGAVISCPQFVQGESYNVYLDGIVTGSDIGGVYDISTITAYEGGTQMQYTGTDVSMGFGGRGGQGPGGKDFQDFDGERPELPDGETMPEGGFGGRGGQKEDGPGGFGGERPEGFGGEMSEDFEGKMPLPDGETLPEGETPPDGDRFEGGRPDGAGMNASGEANTVFYMQDKVNAFSGVSAVAE
ncbi:MAG: carbohydrate-binding domain-containing protein [Eubacteriales bacterium]|nr:carbohydrate-binding domain-containing protein [Eubacteriales bacterium]